MIKLIDAQLIVEECENGASADQILELVKNASGVEVIPATHRKGVDFREKYAEAVTELSRLREENKFLKELCEWVKYYP